MNRKTSPGDFMLRALALAEQGWGRVHPNPLVGAVIVREGEIVGEGFHREFGEAHAEIEALREAGDAARGATLYVTLEPCAHHGKTPPCTDAIIHAGIATVVIAALDPHPAAGGGAAVLRDAGIHVLTGIERDAARLQNAIFFHSLEKQAPFVALKLAMSLDARIAAAPGRRTVITSESADREVHRLRSGFDAIMVGAGTVRADDPLLTVRKTRPAIRPPIRIVLDSSASLPITSRLMQTIDEAPVWLVCGPTADHTRINALERAGARPMIVHGDGGRPGFDAILEMLHEQGVRSIFCEGGAVVASELLRQDRADHFYALIAPILLGEGGLPAFPAGIAMKSGDWRTGRIAQLGEDTLLMLYRERN